MNCTGSGVKKNWGEPMKILAFDQASRKTGAAWFEDTTLMGYQLIDFSKMKDADERTKLMILKMFELIEEIKPDAIVFENVTLQRSPGAAIMLAQLAGSLIGYCYEHNIRGMMYKPSEWRRMLDFKQGSKVTREALKKQALDFVKEHYDLDVDEDEADAICIGCAFGCAMHELFEKEEQVKAE